MTNQIMSVKALSLILAWCVRIKSDDSVGYAFTFMWKFFCRTAKIPPSCSEVSSRVALSTENVMHILCHLKFILVSF